MHVVAISKRRRDQLMRLREEHLSAQAEADKRAARFQNALAAARDEGLTVKELRELFGFNRARAYQLLETAYKKRDE
jgi:hypothetical protein